MRLEEYIPSMYDAGSNLGTTHWRDLEHTCQGILNAIIEEQIEIPCYKLGKFLEIFNKYRNDIQNISTLSMMISSSSNYEADYKGTAPIIKKFFNEHPRYAELYTYKLGGIPYIGGPGIILDKDYNLLALYTVVFKFDSTTKVLYVTGYNLRINPIVYQYDTTMNKFIRGKMLTNTLQFDLTTIPEYKRSLNISNALSKEFKFNVHIAPLDKFITKPAAPNVNSSSTNINNFILHHLRDL